MHDISQPFINLSTANTELLTKFAQSPEMVELANSSAEKYFELAQKSFGKMAASTAQVDLVRRLTENYSTFAQEYAASLMGIAADSQAMVSQQVQAATEHIANTTQAGMGAAHDVVKTTRGK
jgi:hypothetical protein